MTPIQKYGLGAFLLIILFGIGFFWPQKEEDTENIPQKTKSLRTEIILLYHKNCTGCSDLSKMAISLQQAIPDADLNILDIASDRGKEIRDQNIGSVPVILLPRSFEKNPLFSVLQKKYSFEVVGKKDAEAFIGIRKQGGGKIIIDTTKMPPNIPEGEKVVAYVDYLEKNTENLFLEVFTPLSVTDIRPFAQSYGSMIAAEAIACGLSPSDFFSRREAFLSFLQKIAEASPLTALSSKEEIQARKEKMFYGSLAVLNLDANARTCFVERKKFMEVQNHALEAKNIGVRVAPAIFVGNKLLDSTMKNKALYEALQEENAF